MSRRRAFTVVELLVIVAILAVLMAVLLPSLRSARTQARRAACGGNLRQLGVAMQGYLNDYHDRFPFISMLPSVGPMPLGTEAPVYVADVLGPYLNNNVKVFQCPADTPGRVDRLPPMVDVPYFQSERSSYAYRTQPPHIAGRTIDEVANRIQQFLGEPAPVNTIWVMRDYHNFHRDGRQVGGAEGETQGQSTPGQRNYLYVDGHVTDYEKF